MSLVTNPLHDKNYLQWQIAIEIALRAKMKLSFVIGAIAEPKEGDVDYEQWLRVDHVVRLWILNAFSKEIFIGF